MYPLIQFFIMIIIAGAVLYILNIAPIDPTLKRIAWVVVIVIVLIAAIYMLAPMLTDFGSYPRHR